MNRAGSPTASPTSTAGIPATVVCGRTLSSTTEEAAYLLAGAAQGHFVEQGDIVFNDSGFAHHETGAVVEQDTAADTCGGVNIDTEYLAAYALEEQGEHVAFLFPQNVGQAVSGQCVEPLEEHERLQCVVAGGIALYNGAQVSGHHFHGHGVALEQGADERLQVIAPDIAAGKLARQTHRNSRGQLVAAQHHIVQQPGELRLLISSQLGRGINLLPDSCSKIRFLGQHLFRA